MTIVLADSTSTYMKQIQKIIYALKTNDNLGKGRCAEAMP